MKKLLTLLYIAIIIVMAIVLPNMISNGKDIPIGVISVVGVVLIVLPFFVFGGGNNNGE